MAFNRSPQRRQGMVSAFDARLRLRYLRRDFLYAFADCRAILGLPPYGGLPRAAIRPPVSRSRDTARAMSQENVELVRQGYEAMNSGDIETALAMFDPDVEVHLAQDAGTVWGLDFRATYRGVDGFVEFLAGLSEAWDEFRWEPTGYRDAGDQVVVYIRMTARGRGSGIEISQDMTHVCDVRDEKLIRHETFFDRAEALEAAGLAE